MEWLACDDESLMSEHHVMLAIATSVFQEHSSLVHE